MILNRLYFTMFSSCIFFALSATSIRANTKADLNGMDYDWVTHANPLKKAFLFALPDQKSLVNAIIDAAQTPIDNDRSGRLTESLQRANLQNQGNFWKHINQHGNAGRLTPDMKEAVRQFYAKLVPAVDTSTPLRTPKLADYSASKRLVLKLLRHFIVEVSDQEILFRFIESAEQDPENIPTNILEDAKKILKKYEIDSPSAIITRILYMESSTNFKAATVRFSGLLEFYELVYQRGFFSLTPDGQGIKPELIQLSFEAFGFLSLSPEELEAVLFSLDPNQAMIVATQLDALIGSNFSRNSARKLKNKFIWSYILNSFEEALRLGNDEDIYSAALRARDLMSAVLWSEAESSPTEDQTHFIEVIAKLDRVSADQVISFLKDPNFSRKAMAIDLSNNREKEIFNKITEQLWPVRHQLLAEQRLQSEIAKNRRAVHDAESVNPETRRSASSEEAESTSKRGALSLTQFTDEERWDLMASVAAEGASGNAHKRLAVGTLLLVLHSQYSDEELKRIDTLFQSYLLGLEERQLKLEIIEELKLLKAWHPIDIIAHVNLHNRKNRRDITSFVVGANAMLDGPVFAQGGGSVFELQRNTLLEWLQTLKSELNDLEQSTTNHAASLSLVATSEDFPHLPSNWISTLRTEGLDALLAAVDLETLQGLVEKHPDAFEDSLAQMDNAALATAAQSHPRKFAVITSNPEIVSGIGTRRLADLARMSPEFTSFFPEKPSAWIVTQAKARCIAATLQLLNHLAPNSNPAQTNTLAVGF